MLKLRGITKDFKEFSISDISFDVEKGDYFILLGPSGAGKSLLLETIAGLVHSQSGTIELNGKDITLAPIQQRKIGLVFQDHAIFPHMKVKKNLAYALHGQSNENIRRKIRSMSAGLGIEDLLDRYPSTLSGGELQRVALARTLIQEPEILLLDEPLASMDSRLKSEIRALLRQIHRGGQTIIHVTHDYEEALSLGNRIAVMESGRILQTGTPDEVFHHPRNGFVAHFIGIKNFIPAVVRLKEGLAYAETPGNMKIRINGIQENEKGFVMIRGEDIVLSMEALDSSASNVFQGIVDEVTATPNGCDVCIDAGEKLYALITVVSRDKLNIREGMQIWLNFKATAVKFIEE
ncbi:MAG: ABC transporter ATP-binding protein [Bacteroidetes bacterium]|nr:ABC transporter ATP-binding protein [Bacteroidota bacterium]